VDLSIRKKCTFPGRDPEDICIVPIVVPELEFCNRQKIRRTIGEWNFAITLAPIVRYCPAQMSIIPVVAGG
jgi:hypothetical protein